MTTSPQSPDASKVALRKMMRQRLSTEPVAAVDGCDWSKFLASRLFKEAKSIVAYIAIQKELPLDEIMGAALSRGKALFLPRFLGDRYTLARVSNLDNCLVKGQYGIPEPSEKCPQPSSLDDDAIWLVPGIAFDPKGHRLGRGGGFYDRLLADFPNGITIGVCRDCQLLPEITVTSMDVPMQAIMTPTRWLSSIYVLST